MPDARAERRSASAPRMRTRRVGLRPIADRDSGFLYELMTSPEAGGRVRYAGATPSPEKIAASLWDSVLAQFIVEDSSGHERLGLVSITSPNFRDGHAYLSAIGAPDVRRSGLVAEAALLGFDYAFATWPFRKIYMEATATSYELFKSGLDRFFTEEGRLRDHSFWNGGYVDLHILAVYRATWVRDAGILDRLSDSTHPRAGRADRQAVR